LKPTSRPTEATPAPGADKPLKADSSGDWSLQAKISDRVHQFTETATDLAGNTGASTGLTVYDPSGHKTLSGGSGNDFLIAGKNDILIGGPGNDTFDDSITLSQTLFPVDTVAEILSHTHDTNAGAVIVVDPHDTITLHGVTTAQLVAHSSDFHFF
jgi:Ca2+-binding RTX toxin-like protein